MRWLLRFRKLDMRLKDQRQALVDTFINAIYLYDDKVLITFNYKEGTQTVTFGELSFLFYPAISLRQHRKNRGLEQGCDKRGAPAEPPGVAPRCTDPFKSFSALDNHPLFAVY